MDYSFFNDGIYKDYQKLVRSPLQDRELVGEIVELAQQVEFELKEKLPQTNNLGERINFSTDTRKTRKLLDLLKIELFSCLEPVRQDDIIESLKRVIDFRNWVIHSYFYEWKGKSFDKTVDRNFKEIIALSGLLCCTTIQCDERNFKNTFLCFVKHNPYDKENPDINAPTISHAMDYAKLKLVTAKWLLYEFLDCISNNWTSIFFTDKDKRDIKIADIKRMWGELPDSEIKRLLGE